MERVTLSSINQYVSATVNPADTPEDLFELYSVPSYENQYPEIVKGKEIGSAKAVVQEGDVLICKINPKINRVWVVKHNTEYPLLASSEWIVVRNSAINSNYLKWYFMSPFFRKLLTSQVAGIGGSLTRAQPKQVAKYPVPIVELEKQEKIVNLLEKVNFVISARQQQLAKLDELVKARFVEMFGDPLQNQRGWPTKSLLEMGCCKNGMNFHADDSGIEIRCLGVGDFKDLSVIEGTTQLPMVSLGQKPSEESMLHDGDIVFVRSNGNKNLVGRCVVVYPGTTPTTYSGFCIRYRLTCNDVMIPYLMCVLKSESTRSKMTGRGANIQNLNQQILATLNVPIPPMECQQKFADIVVKCDRAKLSIQKSLEQMETLKKSLMQKYFG